MCEMSYNRKISVFELSIMFNVGVASLYQKIRKRKFQLYKIGRRYYLDHADAQVLIQENHEFKHSYIEMKTIDYLLLRSRKSLIENIYYHNPKFKLFKNVVRTPRKMYVSKQEWDEFYDSIERQPLVKMRYIIQASGFRYASKKFYDLLEISNFYQEVRTIYLCDDGKRFFPLCDVKKWLNKNQLTNPSQGFDL